MRLKTLSLKNIRLFGDEEQTIHFCEDKNVTIIVGNNGAGKSTILDAIANQLTVFTSQFQGNSLQQYKDTDIHIDDDGKMAPFLEVDASFGTTYNGDICIKRYRKGTEKKKTSESHYEEARNYAFHLIDCIENEQECNLPLLAYYGTGRGQIQVPERKRNFQQVFSRWDCYNNSLVASTNFKRFFAWFDLLEDEERREKLERKDFDYRSPMLEAVRYALNNFIDSKFANPRIETKPLRFVVNAISNGHSKELRIEHLSEGYKMAIAMVADIASRMAEANPEMENPLLATGIVLVDEIDLHLHPKWQKTIIKKLCEIFPNIQFIVTSHSPTLLLGAIDLAQLIVLNDGTIKDASADDFSTYDVSQILLSELFGLEGSRAPKWDEKIKEQDALLAKHNLSNDDKHRLELLDKELSTLSFGSTLESIQTRQLINRIANKLGIKDEKAI